MKVLLINENRYRESIIPYPLGLAYISTASRAAGHEVAGLDLMFSDDVERDIENIVAGFKPDAIGLSIRNIDNQDSRNTLFFVEGVKAIVDQLKRTTGAPVILGGAGFSTFPLECLRYLGAELGVVGEGEETFPLLLECIRSGGDPADLSGVASLKDGEETLNPPRAFAGFSSSLLPDRETFDTKPYTWKPGTVNSASNLQARRGCPMHCIYCSTRQIEGPALRMRDINTVADELESLEAKYSQTIVAFSDSMFSHPAEYTKALCGEIAGRKLGIKWVCTYNPSAWEPGQFNIMREAGCAGASIGNESGSEDILKALKKGFGKKQIRASIEEAKSLGIRVTCFLMLGGPGETRDTVEESVEFMDELGPDMVNVTPGIRITPGCELERIAEGEGIIKPGQNLLDPVFYISKAVEPWIYDYAIDICKDRDGWDTEPLAQKHN